MCHSAVAHNKSIIVVGGHNIGPAETFSSVEVYSIETNQFSFVSPMSYSRANFGCCLVNSKVYVISGYLDLIDEKVTYMVEVYDIVKDVWHEGPSLPFLLNDFSCSTVL